MAAPKQLEIHIRGTGTAIKPAERALMTLSAQSREMSSEAQASSAATSTALAIRELLAPHCVQDEKTGRPLETAGIAHYSMSTLDTQMHQAQRNRDTGVQPDPTFTARADFTIKFRDFTVLNELATKLSAMRNVRISRVEWRLTDNTFDSIKGGARKLAAEDALTRAYDYSEVFVGLSRDECAQRVKPYLVEEERNYSQSTRPQLHYGKAQRFSQVQVDSQDLQFEPEDVRLEVSVSAKFKIDL